MTETSTKKKPGWGAYVLLIVTVIYVISLFFPSKHSSGKNELVGYPKECKGGCGYEIKSSYEDDGGYHTMCKPGKDGGKSTYERARNP